VPDGDTLVLTDGRVVRLVGIDAPEVAHEERPTQLGAEEARAELARLVRDRMLTIRPVAPYADQYGRVLALVSLPDGTTAQAGMLRAGLAFVFYFVDQDEQFFRELLPLQRQAMQAGRGFWPRLTAGAVPGGGLVGNVKSRRFGTARCAVAGHIAKHNRRLFGSVRAAFWHGFSPYRECGWWPAAGAGPGF